MVRGKPVPINFSVPADALALNILCTLEQIFQNLLTGEILHQISQKVLTVQILDQILQKVLTGQILYKILQKVLFKCWGSIFCY